VRHLANVTPLRRTGLSRNDPRTVVAVAATVGTASTAFGFEVGIATATHGATVRCVSF
jgi:hypothetical protein